MQRTVCNMEGMGRMIPPVESRQNRDCYDCIFSVYDDQAETCSLLSWLDGERRRWHNRLSELRNGSCNYHFTKEEIRELIDSGVIG